MVTFMILAAILIIVAIVIGIILLVILAIAGVTGGVLVFLFGDIIIGVALFVLLLRGIFRRRR